MTVPVTEHRGVSIEDLAETAQARGDKLRAYWVRWRHEQRQRKAAEAREALEAAGQLSLSLGGRDPAAEVFD
jgi:hypothetical protein